MDLDGQVDGEGGWIGMDGWMDEWMDGWVDGGVNEWMDG